MIERLYEVAGIGKKRVEKIRDSWEKQKDIKNVMIPLSLLRLWSGWLFGALLAVMVLIPTVYSYALHRKGI